MTDAELGQATIVYEGPDGETVEETIDNEYVAYFQDHWIIKADEGETGHDTVQRIPVTRVYHVERDVEEFEEEIRTVRDQVQSLASDLSGEVGTLRDRIESVADRIQRERRGNGADGGERGEPIEIHAGEGGESMATESPTAGSETGASSTGGTSTDESSDDDSASGFGDADADDDSR